MVDIISYNNQELDLLIKKKKKIIIKSLTHYFLSLSKIGKQNCMPVLIGMDV